MSENEKDDTAKRVTVSYQPLSTKDAIRKTKQLRHASGTSPSVFVFGRPGKGKSLLDRLESMESAWAGEGVRE
ncbi:DNA replication protein DnaC [Arthrobacter sp. GAS37]|uniref:hypothetical protein n=1 Tax=Arthrobacter sp. GAS37 TaxID=3156261 RepID=UPI0038378A44